MIRHHPHKFGLKLLVRYVVPPFFHLALPFLSSLPLALPLVRSHLWIPRPIPTSNHNWWHTTVIIHHLLLSLSLSFSSCCAAPVVRSFSSHTLVFSLLLLLLLRDHFSFSFLTSPSIYSSDNLNLVSRSPTLPLQQPGADLSRLSILSILTVSRQGWLLRSPSITHWTNLPPTYTTAPTAISIANSAISGIGRSIAPRPDPTPYHPALSHPALKP